MVIKRLCFWCKVFVLFDGQGLKDMVSLGLARSIEHAKGQVFALPCKQCGTLLPAYPSDPRSWYGANIGTWNPCKRVGSRWFEELRPKTISIHQDIYDTWRWRCSMPTHQIRVKSYGTGFKTQQECLSAAIIHGWAQHGARM